MLAARDQENLVHGHHQVAASKPLNQGGRGLQPKTPGNRFPKTPLKVPLHDENTPAVFGGKSGKGKGLENLMTGKKATFDKNAFVTPMGPRTRAPLGAKTTNAKAKAFQTPAGPAPVKDIEQTQPQQSARRPKKITHPEAVKLEVHGDESPLAERDVEYAPPRPKDIPYRSEDFPDGCLNYEPLKPGNLMKGIYRNYYSQVDEKGMTRQEREEEASYIKSSEAADKKILEMLEEEWTVGDVPETFRHLKKKPAPALQKPKPAQPPKKNISVLDRAPATIVSRKAASALSVGPKSAAAPPQATKPKPTASFLSRPKVPPQTSNASTMRHTAATATSRSTIGYSKGRSASGIIQPKVAPTLLQPQKRQGGMTRSVSMMSQSSDTTITPERFAQREELESKKLGWLVAFDVENDDLEPGLRGGLPECLRRADEDEEEFVMTLGSTE